MSKRPWGQVVDKQGSAVKDFISNYYIINWNHMKGKKVPRASQQTIIIHNKSTEIQSAILDSGDFGR